VHSIRVALLLAVLAETAAAQIIQAREPRLSDQWTFGGSAFGGLPIGEFHKHENGGGGGEFMLGFQPFRRQPLVLRANVNSMLYGYVSAYGYQDICCDAFGNYYTQQVRYNARNHTMTILQGGPEFMATDGLWRPFGFALAGVTFFNSWANVKPSTPNGAEYTQGLFSSHNFSTTYGAGLRRVRSVFGREGGFELAFRVTRNAKARYLTEEGVHQNSDGSWSVDPRTGAANVAGIHIGFWVGPYINWNER
jgi:hypothetical protein